MISASEYGTKVLKSKHSHTMRTLLGHWPGNHVAVKARQDMTESCPDLLFLLFLNISIIIIIIIIIGFHATCNLAAYPDWT